VSGPDPAASGRSAPDEPPADEEYARTYAAGYEEGVRTALRELLAHASRGRTNQELRALILSRLARLREEVDLKRRSLLAPPRPRPFGELVRPALGLPSGGPPSAAVRPVPPGGSVLVREARPEHAIELLLASRAGFPRTVLVSLRPPALPAGGETIVVPLRGSGELAGERLELGQVSGRLREPIGLPGGALVYVDALEFFVAESSPDLAMRFARWLVTEVQEHAGGLIVSYDPRALVLTDVGRLERLFGEVVNRSPAAPLSPP